MWRTIASASVGFASAIVYLIVTGYLLFHAKAVESGLVFLWNLEPVTVTAPRPPFLQMVSLLLWSALIFWSLLEISARSSAIKIRPTLLTAAIILVVVALAIMATADYPQPSMLAGTDPAVVICLRTAGLSPATMAMAAGLAVFAFSAPSTRADVRQTKNAAKPESIPGRPSERSVSPRV